MEVEKLAVTLEEAFAVRDVMVAKLKVVDELTLASAQKEVQHLLSYIGTLEGELYPFRVQSEELLLSIKKIDIAIASFKDLVNKTQRAISQGLKYTEAGG